MLAPNFVRMVLWSVVMLVTAQSVGLAADWPTWRANAGRTATTDETLPSELRLQWTRQLPPLTPAWPEDVRLHFDANYEPVVMGRRMFVGSSAEDCVTAFDLDSGNELWRFGTEGPVRFAPVAKDGRVFFGADDGCVYCVDAASGNLVWKFNAAPNQRKALGSERLISVWPVRGGPMLDGGKLFFTVGVWPFEGTFLYALDAATGQPLRCVPNASPGALVTRDRTPQGYLAAAGDRLFVPCGRSVAGCLDRQTGEWLPFTYRPSETTGYHVSVTDRWLFHGSLAFDTQSKSAVTGLVARHAVLSGDVAYIAEKGNIAAYDLKAPKTSAIKDKYNKESKKTELTKLWSFTAEASAAAPATPKAPVTKMIGAPTPKVATIPSTQLHIRAGSRLYGSRKAGLFALDLASGDAANSTAPKLSWSHPLSGTVMSLVAANGKLIAVTREGQIACFGTENVKPTAHVARKSELVTDRDTSAKVERLLQQTGVREGYAVVMGLGTERFVDELLRQSKLRVIGVDRDAATVAAARKRLEAAGVYGSRVSLHVGDPLTFGLPSYIASLVTSGDPTVLVGASDKSSGGVDASRWKELYRAIRPYGGIAVFDLTDAQHTALQQAAIELPLANARITRDGSATRLEKVGALPGSADWTHEYGDPSNTLMSRDDLVRAPLGVLWFGGPASSGDLFYNRHFWGPSMAVLDGRMLIQGPKKMTAVDVYTGRILWQKALTANDANALGREGNDFEVILAGYHFVTAHDGIYVVQGEECLRLDPATGNQVSAFKLPNNDPWGSVRIQGDILLTEAFRKNDNGELVPKRLVAVNRHTGKTLWTKDAAQTFPVVAVSQDKVFVFDGAITDLYKVWKRKGLVPKADDVRMLKAFDLQTGKQEWERSTPLVVTWIGYSADTDVLITSNKENIAALQGKNGQELWQKEANAVGFRGHPEALWDKLILWKDRILDQRGPGLAYDLKTGKSIQQKHPVTGEAMDWEFTKTGHHCNYAIANPHLLTFRADTAGFCDISTGNTARLDGFRSGCRNSLIPANGVLNSPNFAYGCVCGYSLFTSLALVHVPENEVWSYNAIKPGKESIRQIGVNLGARGDRVSSTGTMWLEYPAITGSLQGLTVKTEGETPRWFQQHSAFLKASGDQQDVAWVAATGVEGLTEITLGLGEKFTKPRQFTVRLYFLEPDTAASSGKRRFDVFLQDQAVLKDFEVAREAGGELRPLVKQFDRVETTGEITIRLVPKSGRAVISGVELIEAAKGK